MSQTNIQSYKLVKRVEKMNGATKPLEWMIIFPAYLSAIRVKTLPVDGFSAAISKDESSYGIWNGKTQRAELLYLDKPGRFLCMFVYLLGNPQGATVRISVT